MRANLYALIAIALWGALSALGVALQHLPPFLLTGLSLMAGGLLALPSVIKNPQLWRVTPAVLGLGVATLFGFHFILFIALRLAPAVEVNLVNYLWPLFIVVLAPFYLPGVRLRRVHVLAALVGFVGAAIAILGATSGTNSAPATHPVLGYALALLSALIWTNYSLQTKRLQVQGRGFPTAAIGLFCGLAGALSLLCHLALEARVPLTGKDGLLLAVMGLGPLGAAFFLWDKALKAGDARHIGILSYLTPLLSTLMLMLATQRPLTWNIALAATLIVGAAVIGTRR
jgi:drug/metabolite transporter (DMT)-like permease